MDISTGVARAVGSSRRVALLGVVLAGGVALAACGSSSPSASSSTTSSTAAHTTTSKARSSNSNPGTGSSSVNLSTVLGRIKHNSGATFSVTYNIMTSAGKAETVTFAQDPPKEAIVTSSGAYYVDGSSVTVCQGQGSSATCTSLPSSEAAGATAISDLFAPGILTNTLQGIEGEVAAHVAGVSLSSHSATYGGQASTCVDIAKSGQPSVTYCASTSSGVLTYFSAGGNTGTLTAYDASPPSSTFSPPAGATVNTLPSGTP